MQVPKGTVLFVSCATESRFGDMPQGYQQKKGYIIAQSPMQETVVDFWRAVLQHKCATIVMLCNLVENDKVQSLCRLSGHTLILPLLSCKHVHTCTIQPYFYINICTYTFAYIQMYVCICQCIHFNIIFSGSVLSVLAIGGWLGGIWSLRGQVHVIPTVWRNHNTCVWT